MSEEKDTRRVVVIGAGSPTGRIMRDVTEGIEHVPRDVPLRLAAIDFASLERRGLAYILKAPPDRYCDDRAATFRALYGGNPARAYMDLITHGRHANASAHKRHNKRKAQRRARTGRK